ncbi:GNAT family N-acetyltransferase [Ruegeria sp. HKCCA4008]|uniref:GNAT family N-acetyltransferase n=1 Tax=Ruegeria sp. HKCCA4008 TaxID=2682999 RepID=UPI001C2B9A21|nr:GNAT family N-acetyltransferase [Ruegeria sp. HKCCA4008]
MTMISQDFFDNVSSALTSRTMFGEASNFSAEHHKTLAFLLPLSEDYPNIERWFTDKVVLGEFLGTRHIVRFERDGRLAALGIAKDEDGEKKICTVRVHPEYFGRGLGVRVFDHLLNWLQVDRPLLTVSEKKLLLFQRLFDHYGFVQTSVTPDLYRKGVSELGFNEQQPHFQA